MSCFLQRLRVKLPLKVGKTGVEVTKAVIQVLGLRVTRTKAQLGSKQKITLLKFIVRLISVTDYLEYSITRSNIVCYY